MSMVQIAKDQLAAEGVPEDSQKAEMVLQLAAWEDQANSGQLAADPDTLAMIRHYILFDTSHPH